MVRRPLRGPSCRPAVRVSLLSLAVLAGLGVTGCTSALAASAPGVSCGQGAPKLTVNGEGLATGTPDLLTLTLSVSTTAGDAASSLSQNNAATSAVLAALKQGGVAADDIQTTGLSIAPQYNEVDGSNVLSGYTVANSVVAMLRHFGSAGAVIDGAADAGGNAAQVQSLIFSIADPRDLQDRARQDAVHQAVAHARSMAAAADEQLGPLCALSDQTTPPSEQPYGQFQSPASGATAGVPSNVPLESGAQQAQAQVSLVYALVPGGARHAG